MATERLREICQGPLPPAHIPQMTVTGFGVAYPEDPTVWTNAVGWRWELPTTRALAPALPRTAGPGPR
eukprot:8807876-Alexandrium_andersonii.AAC.1